MQRPRAAEHAGEAAIGERLAAVDWRQPWLEGWREAGEAVQARLARGETLCDALNAQAADAASTGASPPGFVPRFVPQQELRPSENYELHIHRTRSCPTRDNLHDFFNALCWLRFPQTKAWLNRMQAGRIAADGIGPVRGEVRDALTLFDENAALLHAPDLLWHALAERNWQALFADLRPLWKDARLVLFGHALLEKLVAPRKAITAHVWRCGVPLHDQAALDCWLAGDLSAARLQSSSFAPLPVLGVPGWWRGNEEPCFYADAAVFRPRQAG